jgi:aminopeptidase N
VTIRALSWLLALQGLGASAFAADTYDFDHTPGRLPKTIVPLDYTIALTPDPAARSFGGHESIRLRVREASSKIVMDSANEVLSHVTVDDHAVLSVSSDDTQQLTTIVLSHALPAGEHVLTFDYVGLLETRPRGFFVQSYTDARGAKGTLLSTQLESIDARRMFPCWDEPSFRATFELSVTAPAGWTAVSNMSVRDRQVNGVLATTTFERSPAMATYLIELTVGDLKSVSTVHDNTTFAVWAVRGQESNGKRALANSVTILDDYNNYFGYRYPLGKLDSIAIPGGFTGAMENWGAITYIDQTLLVGPSGGINDIQQVFSFQAHEMAHQWNGDLVTMAWWDDLWLNESFASWMSAKETDRRNPDWHWWENQDAAKETAMNADANAASHPIYVAIDDENQGLNTADPQITYAKGQAVLRMQETYIGPDVFQRGIQHYMKARAFSNATSADLWLALNQASGTDIAGEVAGWTEQPGFPLISVTTACDARHQRTLTLSQQRFLKNGSDTQHLRWRIPLRIRTGSSAAPHYVLLTDEGQTVSAGRCGEALSLNADDIGYYRVKYDADAFQSNQKAFRQMPDGDRIALLDDEWALTLVGAEPLSYYLALASAMGADRDARAWTQIDQALERIAFDERGRPSYARFTAYGRALIRPVVESLGWKLKPGEPADRSQLRRLLLASLGEWGDPDVIADAQRRFQGFIAQRSSIAPDDQAYILSIVAQNADATTFDRLHTLAQTASDDTEIRRFYTAIMNVKNPVLAQRTAELAVSEELPPQVADLRLIMLAQLAVLHPRLSWQTLNAQLDRVMAPYVGIAGLIYAQNIPQIYWSDIPVTEFDEFVRAHVPKELGTAADAGLADAHTHLAERETLRMGMDSVLK